MKLLKLWIGILVTTLSFTGFSDQNKSPLVYVIPIHEEISSALLYVVRRGATEAEKTKANAVVFTMDTPGGRVDITREILEIIRDLDVDTYTFVERDAYSAGAIIALGTKHIYMAPSSVIGAATPIMMSPSGGVQDLNEDVSEKMKSGVAAMVRVAAEQGGHDQQLAEAMVRREAEYKVGTNVVSSAGELLTLTASEAEGILSEGTVDSIEAMLVKAGLPNAEIKELEISSAEKIARIISAIAPILLMIGLGGIYLEIKTPGIGIFGIGGAIALALFFFGHHIAGLAGMEDFLIFAAGFALIFIEVFITPGFGILGIGGLLLILVALVNAMSWQAPGNILPSASSLQSAFSKLTLGVIGSAVVAVVIGRMLPKSKAFRPLILSASTDKNSGFSAAHDKSEMVGKTGIAEMNLHPSGRALIGEQRVNVITHGEFIDKGTQIKVTETHGNRIIVEKI